MSDELAVKVVVGGRDSTWFRQQGSRAADPVDRGTVSLKGNRLTFPAHSTRRPTTIPRCLRRSGAYERLAVTVI